MVKSGAGSAVKSVGFEPEEILTDNRACGSIKTRWSPPPVDACNSRGAI
ncbi:hypothetical protein EVAR_11475_1, partial [Eumeta japonica]